jgi:hypothetical protein
MFMRTALEIADCHTVIGHIDSSSLRTRLPLNDAAAYHAFLQSTADAHVLKYAAVAGKEGAILKNFRPAWAEDTFWRRLVSGGVDNCLKNAWNYGIPVEARLLPRLDILRTESMAGLTFNLQPRVLLFPFGWTTWLSTIIEGEHDLMLLAKIVRHLFGRRPAWAMSGSSEPFRLQGVLDYVSRAIKGDAFWGDATDESATPDTLVLATVLAKKSGFLSSQGLHSQERQALREIVKPAGPPLQDAYKTQLRPLKGRDPNLNFIFVGPFGRFIYAKDLLDHEPGDLVCYHQNSLLSFILAWHQASLLRAVHRRSDPPGDALASLAKSIRQRLGSRDYRSQSLNTFLEDEFVTATLKELAGPEEAKPAG